MWGEALLSPRRSRASAWGQTVSPSASYLIKPQVTKGLCSRFGPSFVRVPSLRSRSVGPRRTDIHVLTALSPHPCGSAHSARPAFSLHPSRDWRCLDFLCRKNKSRSKASRLKPVLRCARIAFSGTGFSREEAGVSTIRLAGYESLHWMHALLFVGPASAGKRPVWTLVTSDQPPPPNRRHKKSDPKVALFVVTRSSRAS
jgi:hypothetical protein